MKLFILNGQKFIDQCKFCNTKKVVLETKALLITFSIGKNSRSFLEIVQVD